MNNYVFIIFLLASCLAVGFVEFPNDCLVKKESACHFGTVSKPSKYETDNVYIFMDKNTLLKSNNGLIEWVFGSVLLEVSSSALVKYKEFTIKLEKGKYLLFGQEAALSVDVLDGHFRLEQFEVTEGFQATFKTVDNRIKIEPMRVIDFKEHIIRYVNAKQLNRSQAVNYIDELKLKYKNYLIWGSELNQNLIQRSIAEDNRLESEKKLFLEKSRLSKQKQKQSFFDKTFER